MSIEGTLRCAVLWLVAAAAAAACGDGAGKHSPATRSEAGLRDGSDAAAESHGEAREETDTKPSQDRREDRIDADAADAARAEAASVDAASVDAASVDAAHSDAPGVFVDPEWPPDLPLPPELDFPPWVNMPEPGRIVVSWRTVAKTTGRVRFGPTPAYGDVRVTSGTAANLHHVDLGVLPPATGYHYQIEIDGTSAVRQGVFVTPGRASWRFAHFGELHAPSKAEEVARSAAALRAFRPHVLVESGDMVDVGDDLDHWRSYMRTSAPWISNAIILPAGSNHVKGPGGNFHLKDLFVLPGNERWYPTRYGQVLFLTLDSTASSNSDIGSKTPDFIAEQTRIAHDGVDDPAFLIGAWHYPACSSQFASRASTRAWIQAHFVGPFKDNGGVDLILVGHDKYYERSMIGSIVHLQTNIGSVSPDEPGDDHPDCRPVTTRRDTLSVGLFEVNGTRIAARIVDDAGGEIDTFTLESRGARPPK